METLQLRIPDCGVEHSLLDAHHHKLQILCRRLEGCPADTSAGSLAEFHAILHELQAFAREHFALEKALLEKRGAASLAEHEAGEVFFSQQVSHFLCQATRGMVDKTGLCRLLAEWWGPVH